MKEIITNELIQYETGFIDGKFEIIEAFKLGKIMDLNESRLSEEMEESWYNYGYQDGFNYFSDLIDNNSLDLENINTKKIMQECFTKKVIEINSKQNKSIPISKFRI